MKQYYIICDVSLCHDCNNCFIACKDEHVGNCWLPYTDAQPRHGHRWMNILRLERGQSPRVDVSYLPLPCQHCADALCVKLHPDCVSRREDGIVLIDAEKAKGNKILADSCPYDAIYWNEEAGVAQKCTMCAHLLDGESWDTKVPRCVHSCPTGALEFYQIEPGEMERKIKDEELECFRPELNGGMAGVYYRNIYRFTKLFISGGLLKGGECAEGVMVTISGAEPATCEVMHSQLTSCFGDFKFDGLEPGGYLISVEGEDLRSVTISESLNLGSIVINS